MKSNHMSISRHDSVAGKEMIHKVRRSDCLEHIGFRLFVPALLLRIAYGARDSIYPRPSLIPILNHSLQPSGSNSTTRLPIPLHACNSPLPRSKLIKHLTRLPVPETYQPSTIPRSHETSIRRHTHIDGISTRVMSTETLFPILPETVCGCVDDDLVVAALKTYGFSGGVRGCGC